MAEPQHRWDPSQTGFVVAVLRTMIGMGVVVNVVGGVVHLALLFGLLSGALLAVVLYLIAIQAGRIFIRTGNYSGTMLWLFLSQCVLWVVMAVLLAAIKVHPMGFVIGVSILPASVLVTLAWYAIRRRMMPS